MQAGMSISSEPSRGATAALHWARRNPFTAALAIAAALDLLILLTGTRILIHEEEHSRVIVPGYLHAGFGQAGISESTLECTYFTGRSMQTASVSTFYRDECPFIVRV
jgi:hypothetical protein